MTNLDTIAEKLGQAREGSLEALSDLLEKYRSLLLWTAQQGLDAGLRTKFGASDVVQETLLEAFRDFPQFQGQSDEQWQAWLRQVLANNLANFERRYRHADKRLLERERSIDAESAVRREAERAVRRESPVEIEAMRKEHAASLTAALSALPDDYRQVLLLRYQQQLAFSDIATRMGRSENAVRKLWARAVRSLQEQMEPGP